MCRKIRCDGKSQKLFGFQRELNKALLPRICHERVGYEGVSPTANEIITLVQPVTIVAVPEGFPLAASNTASAI